MNIELLKKLCEVKATSGHEEDARECISNELKAMNIDYTTDALGNLIARIPGDGPKIMLAGHMDQIGFLVSYIDDKGFLRFANLGGLSIKNLVSQRVIFKNGTFGVVSCEKLETGKKDYDINNLYIDIGTSSKEESEKLVSIGDIAVFYAPALADSYKVMAPALDDRVGCFIMLEAMKKLKSPKFDSFFVFTVQEELGLRGAKTAAYGVDPDYAVAFDVTLAYDTPKEKSLPMAMGKGAAIKIMDSSVLCHPTIVNHLENAAKENNIKYQFEILTAGGTDSGAIHVSRAGVPSGVVSVVTRYVHSDSEMCAISDIEDCIDLTVAMLERSID